MKTLTYIFAAIGLVSVLRSDIGRAGLSIAAQFLAASAPASAEGNREPAIPGASTATPSEGKKPKSLSLDLPAGAERTSKNTATAREEAMADGSNSSTEAAEVRDGTDDSTAATIRVLRMYEQSDSAMKSEVGE